MICVDGSGDSSLVRRIAAAPHPQAADEARARVDEWLAEIADLPAGKTLTRLSAAHPRLEALMMGLADGSPYLWGLVRGSPERFVALLEAEPEHRFRDILADARGASAAARRNARAISCSPWVKWGRASSIIRAISTSSSSTILQRSSSRQRSRRHFMC